MTMTPSSAAAMKSVPVDKAGVGSAVLNASPAGRGLDRGRPDGRDHGLAAGRDGRSPSFLDGLPCRAARRRRDRVRRRRRRGGPPRRAARAGSPRRWRRGRVGVRAERGRRAARGRGAPRRVRRLPAVERRDDIVDAALARVRDHELRGRDDRRDRPRGGCLGADPLPALRRRSGTSSSPASTPSGMRLHAAWRTTLAAARPDEWLRRDVRARDALVDRGTVIPPNLWIQGLTGAGDDAGVRDGVRQHMLEVHEVHRRRSSARSRPRGRPGRPRSPRPRRGSSSPVVLLRSVAERRRRRDRPDRARARSGAERHRWLDRRPSAQNGTRRSQNTAMPGADREPEIAGPPRDHARSRRPRRSGSRPRRALPGGTA